MEMLGDEKKKQLVENINQYNHLLGNFLSENMEKKGQEDFDNQQQLFLLKVSLSQCLNAL